MGKSLIENKVKHLIKTRCPRCNKGELKKKHNRQVVPAKPFLGCTNYPRCDYSLEMDGSKPEQNISDDDVFSDDVFDGLHPYCSEALGQD